MFLNRKAMLRKAAAASRKSGAAARQEDRNVDTAERVKEALKNLGGKFVVLAIIPSSKAENPPYQIRLVGNAVVCNCDGFKYRSECSHMKRFRTEVKSVTFK